MRSAAGEWQAGRGFRTAVGHRASLGQFSGIRDHYEPASTHVRKVRRPGGKLMPPVQDQKASPRRKKNQQGEGLKLRGELIDAAMRILDRSPDAKLSLRMVAREAGVSAPAVYSHFADADTLLSEIVYECFRGMADEIAMAAKGAGDAEPFERFKCRMAAYVRYAMERPSRYQSLFSLQARGQDEIMRGPLQPVYRQVRESIRELVADGMRLPVPDEMSSVILALSLAHGRVALAHLWPTWRNNTPQRVETYVLTLLERIFRQDF